MGSDLSLLMGTKRTRRQATGKRAEIVVDFNGDEAFRRILNIFKDGEWKQSARFANRPEFADLISVSEEERAKWPDPEDQERYARKKRDMILRCIHAMHLLGILQIRFGTSASVYQITPQGEQIIHSLGIGDRNEKNGR